MLGLRFSQLWLFLWNGVKFAKLHNVTFQKINTVRVITPEKTELHIDHHFEIWQGQSSELKHHVIHWEPNNSEEHIASVFRVKEQVRQETSQSRCARWDSFSWCLPWLPVWPWGAKWYVSPSCLALHRTTQKTIFSIVTAVRTLISNILLYYAHLPLAQLPPCFLPSLSYTINLFFHLVATLVFWRSSMFLWNADTHLPG
jgi:hypothetical protein